MILELLFLIFPSLLELMTIPMIITKPLIDFHTWLMEDLLQKVDKMSMTHGLEVRVPYLEVNYVVKVFSMNYKQKINSEITKHHVRKILRKYVCLNIQ